MANVVHIIISDIAHIVYIRFKAYLNFFEIALSFPQFDFYEISTPLMPITLWLT